MLATETRYAPIFNRASVAQNEAFRTKQLSDQLRQIQSGVSHIKLDNHFLRTSNDWSRRFNPEALDQEKKGAAMVVGRTGSLIGRTAKEQEMQVGNMDATLNLEALKRDIGPYATQSADRIRQFCDHVGVTDRFTGYRNNLNRGFLDPTRPGQSYLANQSQKTFRSPYQHIAEKTLPGRLRPTQSAPLPAMETSGLQRERPPPTAKSIQEQCGINMTFPGRTEYMHRYATPDTAVRRSYTINPSPDFYIYGRPLAKLVPARNSTEYQFRFDWPDGNKIAQFPWLRK